MTPKPNSLSPAILSSYGISSQCDFHRTLNIFRAVPSGLLLMKSRCEKCCESSSLTRIEELQLRSSIRDLSQTPSQICGLEWRTALFLKDDAIIYPPCAARFLVTET